MNYTWRPAYGTDVNIITNMAVNHFQREIEQIFVPDPIAYSRNITIAIVNQFFNPLGELVSVCTDTNNNIVAYIWAKTNERATWSDEEMLVIKIAHVDMTLSPRIRIKLINDMITMWENFATLAKVSIICSSTMRTETDAFLKLHKRHGYDVRGSYAYKKLSA